MSSISSAFFDIQKRYLALFLSLALLTALLMSGCQQTPSPQIGEVPTTPEVEPSLDLAAVTVLQNGEFRLSVAGFGPGEQVQFRVQDGQADVFREIGHAKADADGQVRELALELPEWITSGQRTLEALGQSTNRRVESVFYVRADKPWVNFSAYAAKQDSSLGLNAGGFEPGENVSIFFEQDPQTVLAAAVADPAGNLEWNEISLRGLQPGQYRLMIVGETSQIKIAEPIVVSPRAPWIDLHTYTIGPGGRIGFDGHDFAPDERVRVFLDEPAGTPLTEVRADEGGNFTSDDAYTAKPGDVGRHRIVFVPELTSQSSAVSFEVIAFTPAFQMTTYSGPPGTETSFNGYGFAPGEVVRVLMQGVEQPVATIQVDVDGSFTDAGRFMVPRSANGGNLGILLEGQASGVRLTQQFSVVRIQPFLGLDPYAGVPGTVVRFRGLGFAAGENVRIHLENREGRRVATVLTDSEGRFERSDPFTVPGDAMQDVSFLAVGEESGAEASVRFQVILPVNERQ
ncbi:MAG: hypothetical protein HYY30_05245 [Chloroflexi bacterium]|nr:hypothetical protein [Chloroflexota bacterium]